MPGAKRKSHHSQLRKICANVMQLLESFILANVLKYFPECFRVPSYGISQEYLSGLIRDETGDRQGANQPTLVVRIKVINPT